jgi:SLT domain-containing protein
MGKGKGKKEKKDKKDKDAPKRAISAFFYYQKERRDSLKKEQPSLDNKALISKMSEEWNKMKDSEKTKYNNLAAKDKERYEREKKAYEAKKGKKSGTKSAKKDE